MDGSIAQADDAGRRGRVVEVPYPDRRRVVQVSDYAIGTLCTPDRRVPGDGDIPLARVLGHLVDAGYQGVFDLELVGPKIDAEGYDAAVPRAVERLDALLTDLGV